MLQMGDLVTGTDRSYKRSIYRFVGHGRTPDGYGYKKFKGEKLVGLQIFQGGSNITSQYNLPEIDDSDVPVIGELAVLLRFHSFDGKLHKANEDDLRYVDREYFKYGFRLATPKETRVKK